MVFGLQPSVPAVQEIFIHRGVERHEIGPASQLSNQIFGRQGAQLILRQTERNDRAICRSQSRRRNFFEERHVGVAVDSIDDTSVATGRKLFYLRDDLLVIGVAEGGIFAGGNDLPGVVFAQAPADVTQRDAVQQKVLVENEIGGLRINVIGPD